jgi:hypothetical protein
MGSFLMQKYSHAEREHSPATLAHLPAASTTKEEAATPQREGAFRGDRVSPDTLLALQRTHGNQSVQRFLQRSAATVQRKEMRLGGGEFLDVDDALSKDEQKEQIAEAKAIIKDIEKTYGVKVDSKAAVKAIFKSYFPDGKVPRSFKRDVQPAPWKLEELKNLQASLKHYAPILGKARKQVQDADFQSTKQQLKSVGKVNLGVSDDGAGPYTEQDTLGETFGEKKKTVALMQSLMTADHNFAGDSSKQQRGTTTHEFSHALIQDEKLDDFVATFSDYWTDESTAQADANRVSTATPPAEAPITYYGGTNAGEDLAETAKFYFEAPDRLKGGDGQPKGTPGNPAPRRFDFFNKIVLSWTNAPDKVDAMVASQSAVQFQKFKDLVDAFVALPDASQGLDAISALYDAITAEHGPLRDDEKARADVILLMQQATDKYFDLMVQTIMGLIP